MASPPPTKKPKMSTTTNSSSDAEPEPEPASELGPESGTAERKPRYKRRKVAIFLAYCGFGYQGMQKNPGARTIEGDLEDALFLAGAVPESDKHCPKRYDWARSARTDKGVSAAGQVVSGRFYVDPPGFVERLNSLLSDQIRIFGFKRVTNAFSSKKFCDRRRYVYLLPVFALDPNSHPDRESVMASVGSGNELAKCVECSERGRKVAGIMGRQSRDLKEGESCILDAGDTGVIVKMGICDGELKGEEASILKGEEKSELSSESIIEVGNGVDNEKIGNGSGELEAEESRVSIVEERCDLGEINLSYEGKAEDRNGGAEEKIEAAKEMSDFGGEVEVKKGGSELGNEEKTETDSGGSKTCETSATNGDQMVEESNKFVYGDSEKERFNRILKRYVGTHNFHNFTTRTKAEDPSARRYIISFNADRVVSIEGIEFVRCEVVGQSFMLHQIRKMIGLAVAMMRNCCSESLMDTALRQDLNINVPTAPEVGLYLDECFFTSYNQKWKDSHEQLTMEAYAEEAEGFKLTHIFPHIASMEHKEGAVALWLHSLNHRNYPDLRVQETNGGHVNGEDAQVANLAD